MSKPVHYRRILLAEDEEAMRTYLTRALEKAGYAVDSVDCGTAALPLLDLTCCLKSRRTQANRFSRH